MAIDGTKGLQAVDNLHLSAQTQGYAVKPFKEGIVESPTVSQPEALHIKSESGDQRKHMALAAWIDFTTGIHMRLEDAKRAALEAFERIDFEPAHETRTGNATRKDHGFTHNPSALDNGMRINLSAT